MATVEKRHSSRKSGHRKHNDGSYSDTETDREVSSLTDRAFRSLCIGDEAVYNDSDLCASPCAQKDSGRQELKRTAHESFSLRVQQYGQDWTYRGMYGAEIHKGQQWGVYGETGAPEPPQQAYPPRELSLFSNGMTEASLQQQQRRSHSRVSSLIRAFNSEGQGDETVYNDETSWDKSALMSIERELSEFSSYPQNMNTDYLPSNGIFSSQNTNYYSSQAAISQMNSASSFMRSSHSLSTQVNSNFFIHSEFSPFRVWRDQNRFPFHGGQVSGFMPHSEFQKWYETPMYKELSLQPQQHPSMFSQGYNRNTFAPAIPMNPQRSTSASAMMPRASAVEKRCESELAGQYRKRTQSMGANRLPPQRPSTASPSSEMSRRVRDTISSVKSLQQKIKVMAEQNIETQSQDGFYNNDYVNAYDPMVPNTMSSNPYTAPYQIQKSHAYGHPKPQQLLQQHSGSPQPVEHAPVRAESRGATPDIKMSNYKSKSASLFYNLKDNRKRVKATYSPAFKGQDTQEKYKQEPKDFIIDVPEFSANELLTSQDDRGNRLNVPQYGYQAHNPGMHTQNSQPVIENPIDMGKLNVQQYGYQAYNSGILHNSQYPKYSQPDFVNSVENSTIKLNVPQYGYQTHSPMLQNSQHMQNSQYKCVNPMEDRGNRLDVGHYGYQPHSPRIQQNIQFSQFPQNTQNSQQLYLGQNSSEYYRAQMQGEVAPQPGFTGYTHEYYANSQLANGQHPYENISSFAPYKQSIIDKGGGKHVNNLEQSTEVPRFGVVVQSGDYVTTDNSTQQFNEAASGEYTGVDRYNQLKENKYDYNNVYSQDMWGQTNSQQIQKPGIPSAQNYQNINAYSRPNTQENVQNYNYEQKVMENYGVRPHGTANVSNEMLQYAPPHLANTGNAVYNAQQQPGTYRDIYVPPLSHEFNKEIEMKENYAPQDNHKYYDQESKKQSIISSQAGMPTSAEELGQRKDEAIKENGMKGMQSKEIRHFENSKQEKKTEQEQVQVQDISITVQVTKVLSQQNKSNVHKAEINEIKESSKLNSQQHQEDLEKETFTKYRNAQNKDLPTAEEIIKQLRGENSNSDHAEILEVTDKQECMMENEPQKPEPEKQQPIVQHANTEGLKEELIKCELAASSEKARIEQVKPEPSHEERVTTEQGTETQVGAENVERMIEEDGNEAKQAVIELIMESQANTKPKENKDIETTDVKDITPEIEVPKSQEDKAEKELKVKVTEGVNVTDYLICEEHTKTQQIPKEDATNVNDVENVSKSEPQQPVTCEADKVEQTKTELAKTKVELAEIKEQKGEEKVQKDEDELIEQENESAHTLAKEPPVTSKDLVDRGANEHKREIYDNSQDTARNTISTTDNVNEQSTVPDKKDDVNENKVETKQDKKTKSDAISDTRDANEKTKNSYDDPTGSQYVYSESSKDFKLSVASNVLAHKDSKNISENISTKEDAPIEKVEKSGAPQPRDDAKQLLINKCKMSQSYLPDHAPKETVLKSDACKLNGVPAEKVEKYDLSQQKDAIKQFPIERKTKSTEKTGSSKETSLRGLTHKEKAQTKQEILTSKIKAHAEKEISAIKEGFANKDGLKNPTKPSSIGQNVTIRQKPPSQEAYKKQERPMNDDTASAAVTAVSQPAEVPQKQMKNNEHAKDRVVTVSNTELLTSTMSFKMRENHTIQKDKKCGSPTDDKKMKSQHEDKSAKQDNLRKGNNVNLENTAPSIQFQNEIAVQDNSLSIRGIMVTVRERNPSEREENKEQDLLSVRCHNTDKHGPRVETNITILSDKISVNEQDYTETKHFTKETDSVTGKNFTDSTTEKTSQQKSSLPNDRPQRETLLPDHLAEKVVPPMVTVQAKNKVLAETQPLANKQDIIAEETEVSANKPPNAVLEISGFQGQEEIIGIRTIPEAPQVLSTTEMKRAVSVATTSNDNTQDILHIDSIAIRVVPAVAEEVNKATQRTASNSSAILKETQSNTQTSNDDVQKVLSSVRKQAQLLKNQPNLNNTTSQSSENEKSTNEDETKNPPMEEGYFQVDKRDTGPQNNSTKMGQSSEAVSQEQEHPRSLPNQPSSASRQDQNINTSKQIDNNPNDKSNKDEKPGAGQSHCTRRHPMAKGRQRGFATLPDSTDSKVEVKPKPKVPIPEISALADYARLKVIVAKDDEDTLQEQPPNKKEGFFPLIQSRHSRRPVFTVDSQENLVKEKSSQDQPSTQVKVKEPTPLVFPITDKQHQRTGMFKLEAKENTAVQKSPMNQTSKEKTNNGVKNTEDKIKDMLEKSRAKQEEEEKKAAQREEEQRALEREAIVAQIRERRKKQREAERHAEEHGKGKEQKGEAEKRSPLQQNVMSAVNNDEQQKLSDRELLIETNLDGQDRTLQQKTASDAQRQRRAALEEQQKKVVQAEEQRRNAEEEQLRKAVLEEQTRRANEEQQRKAEEQKKAILEEKQRKAAQMEEQKRRLLLEEQQKRVAQEEQQRKIAEEEQQRQAAIIEEQKKKTAFEEQQRKLAHEVQQRKAQEEQLQKQAEEQQSKAIIEEQKKRLAIEEQQRKMAHAALEEKKQKAAFEEQQRQAVQKEQQRKMAEEEQQRKVALEKEEKQKAALEEQQRRTTESEQLRKMAVEEQQRKAAIIEEQKKKAAIEEQQRKFAYEEQQKQAALKEQKKKAAVEEEQRRAAEIEQLRKMAEEEHQRKAAIMEDQKKKAATEEQQRKLAYEEQQKQAALVEQKQKAALEEQQRKKAKEEEQRKAAIIEEQKKRAAIEDQQRKLAQEAQQRKAAMEEQKQKAALEEQQRKKAMEEQHRKAAIIEEQKKRAAIEEQRKLAQEAQQRKAAMEEQKQKAALEEQQRRAALEEQQRKKAEEEQHRKAVIIEEQKKRAAIEEQRKLAQEAQQRKAAMEEQKQKDALEEQQRRAAQKEQQRKMAEEEQQKKAGIIEAEKKRAAIEEQQRKATAEEKQRKEALIEEQERQAVAEEQRRQAVLKEEQRRAALEEQLRKNKMVEEEQRRKEALEEQQKIAQIEEMRRQAAYAEHLKKSAEIEKQKRIAALQEEQQRKAKLEEQKRKAAMEEERKMAQIEEKRRQAAQEEELRKAAEIKELKRREALEEQKRNAAIEEQRKLAQIEEMRRQAAHEEQRRKIAEEQQQRKAAIIEEERRAVFEEEQRREAHKEQQRKAAIEEQRRKEALIEKQKHTRQEEEEKRLAYIREERIRRQIEEEREAELEEKMTRQNQSSEQNQTHKGKDTRLFRAQDLPQNQMDARARKALNQVETAQMEEQKNISDKEALQYYSLTSAEAEKPSSPQKRSNTNGPDTVDDISRPHAPASPALSQPRSTTASPAFGTKPSMFKVKDNTLRGSSLTKSIKPRFHKNFGDEFRVGSPMEKVWEKNEGDLDTLRCRTPSTPLPQHRPFSRRSLALDDEDSRSIISNMSEDVESFATNATDLADIRTLYDSDRPESACSFSSDVSRSFGKPPTVPPKSEKALRRAKRLATRRLKKELSKDVTEDSYEASMSEVANSDVVASPHFTPPFSIAHAPSAGSTVSLSHSEPSHQHALHTPHATGPISLPNSPPHISTPVSVPSSQNPGSFSTSAAPRSIHKVPSAPTDHPAPKPVTQYQVESGFSQSYTQRRVMQDIGSGQYYVVDVPVEVKTKTFFDPETGKYVQLNVRESSRNAPQRQPLQGYPQPHLKPKLHAKLQPNTSNNAQYQSYSSNSKGNQSAVTSGQSLTPATVIQDQQTIRSSMAHRQGGHETSYSPDKTPYMDTVNKVDKAHHTVYNTQGSQRAITETDSQLVNSRYGSRDIITMSELEDFMEVSDW